MLDNVKIPQNIRIEDKIVGPLSLRQILLIAGGGGLSYALFMGVKSTMGTVPILAHAFVWLPAVITSAFALVRINDITLTRYLLLMFETISKPRIRPWLPRQGIIINIQTPSRGKGRVGLLGWGKKKETNGNDEEKPASGPGKTNMVDLVHLLDERGSVTQGPHSSILSLASVQTTAVSPSATTTDAQRTSPPPIDDTLPGDPSRSPFPIDGIRSAVSDIPVHA